MDQENCLCPKKATSEHLKQLRSLVELDFNAPYLLSFNAFSELCCGTDIMKPPIISGSELRESSRIIEVERLTSEEIRSSGTIEMPQSCSSARSLIGNPQQKNQLRNKTSPTLEKSSPIESRHQQIENYPSDQPQQRETQEQLHLLSTRETGSQPRSQNNPKYYHKLIQRYLAKNGLAHRFDEFGVKLFHKYYFVVGLIFIKYLLNQDFNETYLQLVKQELTLQKQKLNRYQRDLEKVDSRIRQTHSTNNNYKVLVAKREKIQKKIEQIPRAMYEIEKFSIGSCRAFFSGNTRESLRILFQKDETVMRKKYYFDPALEIVLNIEQLVRQATSQNN